MDPADRERMNHLVQKVDRLERQVAFLLGHLKLEYRDSGPQLDDVGELLRRGEKLEAIRLHQAKTGMGLADAKRAVEELAKRLGF